MPRSNRPRGRKGPGADEEEFDAARLLGGWRRTEVRRGVTWNVQPISVLQAQKAYTCPACSLEIAPGTEHLVAWRTDGILGDEADLAARRHWHVRCWRIA
ncbi:hypothetical protein [Gryllotalpicola sp.]|uniref:hypothetical protein n=1 Tax=Gryllotalpicola sp. TaxID=1932787 RepID=UPI0026157920|nr:hypothetical protein [Gryllotalpicola sp.]